MSSGIYFISIFIGTILITRLVLLPRRIVFLKIRGQHIHHFIYGLILVGISIIFSNLFLYAVGMGLFVDELPLFITQKWNWKGYNSSWCRTEDLVIVAAIFLLRNHMLLSLKM